MLSFYKINSDSDSDSPWLLEVQNMDILHWIYILPAFAAIKAVLPLGLELILNTGKKYVCDCTTITAFAKYELKM
jgi:hypothetical protein